MCLFWKDVFEKYVQVVASNALSRWRMLHSHSNMFAERAVTAADRPPHLTAKMAEDDSGDESEGESEDEEKEYDLWNDNISLTS